MAATRRVTPRVAILPWGDAIEDFLDTLGVTLEDLRDEMSGGWLFGYVEALRAAGVDAGLVCVSRDPRAPLRWTHRGTGAPLHVLRLPAAYRPARRLLEDPYAFEARPVSWAQRGPALRLARPAHEVLGYLATPVPALARLLRREGYAALLCQEYEYPRFDVCALAQRVLGVPVFATFQGGMAPRTAFEQRFRRRAMHAGAAYAVGSAAEAQRIRERYGVPAAKVHHIPNPLDVAVWHQGDRARGRAAIGVPDDALVVAWHGRVDIHHKGLDVLLHAWSLLARRTDLPPLRLLLVGSGPDSPEVRRRLDAARVEGVTWFDEYVLDKRRLADLLAAGDVYAFPSRREGFPVAPLEAMAAGLPVVAADAPGVAEILPGGEASGGVVVPREDGPALAEALAQLLLDAPRRETMARRARAHVEAVFSLDAVGRALARMLSGPPA